MRRWTLAIAAAALLAPGADARAQGDPIMPLSDVRQGMQCAGYSVIRGTAIDSFDVEILDVVGGEEGARLLVRVSGPAVDETGVGAGFSGSPVYCPGADGVARNAGAISETIGDYGGKTVLATPIEAILATPVDPPTGPAEPPPARTSSAFGGAPGRSPYTRWDPALLRRARPMASPLTISGVRRDLFNAIAARARREGVTLLQAPPTAQIAQAPGQPFRPGSAVGVGMSSGAVAVGAVGTVAYVDAEKVWAFGHSFEGTGERALLLQDAYVAAIVNNPVQLPDTGGTYKLAGSVNDVGTISSDGFNAVAGRAGALPPTIPVRVLGQDADTGRDTTTSVAVVDETDLDNPSGGSPIAFVAPLAITQGATVAMDATPTRIAGEMCLRLVLKERTKPIRVCNRYVSDGASGTGELLGGNLVALSAGNDAATIFSMIDGYKRSRLHLTEVTARVTMTRAQRQAYMRKLVLPRRVRRGERVTAALTVHKVHGAAETIRFKLRIPGTLRSGRHTITLRGRDPDGGDDLFGGLTITLGGEEEESDSEGPTSLEALVRAIRKEQRYDGIRFAGRRGARAYRDPNLRIGGRASATVIVR